MPQGIQHCTLFMVKADQFSSVTQSCLMLCDCRPHGLQHTRLPCPSPTPGDCSNLMSVTSVMPSNHLILCRPLLLLPSMLPSIRVFSNESLLPIRWPKCCSLSFNISPSNEYSGLISFILVWSLCSPRDSRESFPIPQFKSIDSLALSFLYGPTFTSTPDYWKNHRFDYMDLCW